MEVVGFPSLTGPSPVLQEALARKIGVAPVPDARPLDADSLFRAENDAIRVRVEAVLLNLSDGSANAGVAGRPAAIRRPPGWRRQICRTAGRASSGAGRGKN